MLLCTFYTSTHTNTLTYTTHATGNDSPSCVMLYTVYIYIVCYNEVILIYSLYSNIYYNISVYYTEFMCTVYTRRLIRVLVLVLPGAGDKGDTLYTHTLYTLTLTLTYYHTIIHIHYFIEIIITAGIYRTGTAVNFVN